MRTPVPVRLLGGLLSLVTACGVEPAFQEVQSPSGSPQTTSPVASRSEGEGLDAVGVRVPLLPAPGVGPETVALPQPIGDDAPQRVGLGAGDGAQPPMPIAALPEPPVIIQIPTFVTPAVVEALAQARLEVSGIVARANDIREIRELIANPARESLSYVLVDSRGNLAPPSLGRLSASGTYTAPSSIPRQAGERPLQAIVSVRSGTRGLGEISITLIPSDAFVVADDETTQGLVGNVYDFGGRRVDRLPNYDTMTPVASVVMPDVHVPLRSFSAGFPGVRDLFEWFGLRFTGRLKIEAEGVYTFSLTADDGARFYLGNTLVVDNDGVHASRTREGTIRLSTGLHPVRLDYFQGPRYHIQVELKWSKPGETTRSLVPASVLSRPE